MPDPVNQSELATFEILSSLPREETSYVQPPKVTWGPYFIRMYFLDDEHVEQLPTATPQGSGRGKASIVQLADPTKRVIVEWEATTDGSVPTMPDPFVNDDNLVLQVRNINPRHMVIGPDGQTPGYRVSGRYEYAMIDADEETLHFPLVPWADFSGVATTLSDKDFVHGMIDFKAQPTLGT